ncbi:MAG: efflux RND transporter periplasmic adaptor subunit [Bacteroidales bacterium]|nr:efflux RND transporter periplasmic adaptor subunit [Bacteroidales bacterium]
MIALLLTIAASCGTKNKKEQNAEAKPEKTIKVMALSKSEVMRSLEYTANVLPYEELYMAPAQPGRIHKVNVEIGDKVSKGQVLINMDPTSLNQAQLQLINLEKDYRRIDTLYKAGGIAAQQYDQMKTQLDVTRSNVEFLRENVILKAPFSGVITGKYFENGELFSGAPNTQAGKAAIVIIQQINPLKVKISVSEKYYPIIKKGMSASLTCDLYPEDTFKGKIKLIHPTINAATKTFDVEIEIPNSNEKLRPGIFARIQLEVGKEEAVVVSSSSLLVQEGTNTRYVFVYEKGVVKRVNVEVGKRYDDKIEIFSEELSDGMEIVVAGQNKLVNGEKVKVIQ